MFSSFIQGLIGTIIYFLPKAKMGTVLGRDRAGAYIE
jgi:hypothetical protein